MVDISVNFLHVIYKCILKCWKHIFRLKLEKVIGIHYSLFSWVDYWIGRPGQSLCMKWLLICKLHMQNGPKETQKYPKQLKMAKNTHDDQN